MIWLNTPKRRSSDIHAESEGFPILVNEKHISSVWPRQDGSWVLLAGDPEGFEVTETPNDIEGIIWGVV
jgi:hypothetical protein